MTAKLSVGWLIASALVTFLLGSAGSYALYDNLANAQIAELAQEIRRPMKAVKHQTVDAPSNEEATTAVARSGQSMVISECKSCKTIPGATCTGIISTTDRSFPGSKHTGVLSFAKIDGRWEQSQ